MSAKVKSIKQFRQAAPGSWLRTVMLFRFLMALALTALYGSLNPPAGYDLGLPVGVSLFVAAALLFSDDRGVPGLSRRTAPSQWWWVLPVTAAGACFTVAGSNSIDGEYQHARISDLL